MPTCPCSAPALFPAPLGHPARVSGRVFPLHARAACCTGLWPTVHTPYRCCFLPWSLAVCLHSISVLLPALISGRLYTHSLPVLPPLVSGQLPIHSVPVLLPALVSGQLSTLHARAVFLQWSIPESCLCPLIVLAAKCALSARASTRTGWNPGILPQKTKKFSKQKNHPVREAV